MTNVRDVLYGTTMTVLVEARAHQPAVERAFIPTTVGAFGVLLYRGIAEVAERADTVWWWEHRDR